MPPPALPADPAARVVLPSPPACLFVSPASARCHMLLVAWRVMCCSLGPVLPCQSLSCRTLACTTDSGGGASGRRAAERLPKRTGACGTRHNVNPIESTARSCIQHAPMRSLRLKTSCIWASCRNLLVGPRRLQLRKAGWSWAVASGHPAPVCQAAHLCVCDCTALPAGGAELDRQTEGSLPQGRRAVRSAPPCRVEALGLARRCCRRGHRSQQGARGLNWGMQVAWR